MPEQPTDQITQLPLYDLFDEAGRSWLNEIVRVFDEGGYTEAVRVLLADEAEAPGGTDE